MSKFFEGNRQTYIQSESHTDKLRLTSKTENRAVIKHYANIGMTPTGTSEFVSRDITKPSRSRALVY